MASKFEIPRNQGLPSFTKDIKNYFAKIKSGEVSAVSDLVGITEKIVLVVQSDADINLTQVAEIIDCLGNVVKCLLEEHDKLQESHDKLQESHDKLQESVKKLDDRVKHLEKLEEALLVGQIASKVEKVFVGEIVNGTNVTKSRYLTIDQLESALSDCDWDPRQSKSIFKSQEEVLKAKENWSRLQTTFELDYELYGAIKLLKSHRNTNAHPEISVRQARELLANCSDRDIAYRFLDILEKASVKNIET